MSQKEIKRYIVSYLQDWRLPYTNNDVNCIADNLNYYDSDIVDEEGYDILDIYQWGVFTQAIKEEIKEYYYLWKHMTINEK